MNARPCTLYRLFDADSALLYVGISHNPIRRLSQHRSRQPWWSEVAAIDLEEYPDRSECEEAEREAIARERPQYNVLHQGLHGPTARTPFSAEVLAAIEAKVAAWPAPTAAQLSLLAHAFAPAFSEQRAVTS